ncbi:hypothetical protein [Cerasicoccus frondis]|uniref:hypothetical protein n=1 Tax=Cerasicoccus frondis TaxID=490090 RepID=UPI0028524C5F|nr:hypothetical protein [Cerasicoccus frondis]
MKWIFAGLLFVLLGVAFVQWRDVDISSLLSASNDGNLEETSFLEKLKNPFSQTVELTDVEGRTLSCRVVAVRDGEVEIIRTVDEQRFTFPLKRLSEESRELLKQPKFSSASGKPKSGYDLYDEAKEHVRVIVVVSDNTPHTTEVKRFLTGQDFHYVVYDAIKSTRGRELLEQHGLTHGPAFIVGDRVMVGLNASRLHQAIIDEYQESQSGD